MARKFAENVPADLELKLRKHMETCGYAQGSIEMKGWKPRLPLRSLWFTEDYRVNKDGCEIRG